jgi:hypothetical protein
VLDVLFCSKHRLWSDSFHEAYLIVLPYLKGSYLYSCVVYGVNILVHSKIQEFVSKFKSYIVTEPI